MFKESNIYSLQKLFFEEKKAVQIKNKQKTTSKTFAVVEVKSHRPTYSYMYMVHTIKSPTPLLSAYKDNSCSFCTNFNYTNLQKQTTNYTRNSLSFGCFEVSFIVDMCFMPFFAMT
jgi:hypothetical protein